MALQITPTAELQETAADQTLTQMFDAAAKPALTREQWLGAVVDFARPLFAGNGHAIPDEVQVCIAPPQKKGKVIGLCWHSACTEDGSREIWISSSLKDAVEAAACLVHELAHSALPDKTGHKKAFKDLAYSFGLTGPAKATVAGDGFRAAWKDFLEKLGPVPGGRYNGAPATTQRRQKTIPLKNVTCSECGFFAKVRVEQMEMGRLVCPVEGKMLLTKDEDEGGGE